MARQITVLESRKASDGVTVVSGAFWFPIAAANARVPKPQFVSVLLSVPAPNAITVAEQAQLESGEGREESFSVTNAASMTLAQWKADLQRRYTDRATAVAAEPAARVFYGLTYDGAAWSS
jgi:hypothetical protein